MAKTRKIITDVDVSYAIVYQRAPTHSHVISMHIKVLKEDFEFIRREEVGEGKECTEDEKWRKRLSKRYYEMLFKEFAIADLSRYKDKKIGLRWRTEREVVCGKGHFICGSTRCDESVALESFEVNFGYIEKGTKKNALVKVRLCPDCAYKLAYTNKKDGKKRKKKKKKKKKKRRDDSNSEEEAEERKGGTSKKRKIAE